MGADMAAFLNVASLFLMLISSWSWPTVVHFALLKCFACFAQGVFCSLLKGHCLFLLRWQMFWGGRSRSGRKRGKDGTLMPPLTRQALRQSRSSMCSQRRRMWISGGWCMCCGQSPGRLRISPSSGIESACISYTSRSSKQVGSRFRNTTGYWRCRSQG